VRYYNKRIAHIQYNLLNLPAVVQFTSGNLIYENGILKMILHPEGYITTSGTNATPTYHYYQKDHQGNNRVVVNQSGAVEQVNHYYPFGGLFSGETVTGVNDFKYGGKELDRMHGLDWYDFLARQMDSAMPMFTTMDPLAEKYPSMSPYVYCMGNPINAIDPDGRIPILIPLVKGIVGSVVDAAGQVTVSMVNGQGFGEAMSNIDYTSVGASFVTSAITMPGMSTAAKVTTAAVVAADAAIDISANRGVETVVTGGKSVANTAIDAASSVVPGKAVDNVTSSFNKAVSSDLSSNAAATLTKETKSALKQAESVVNSTGVQAGANAAADYVGGVVGGQANKAMSTSSTTKISAPSNAPIVQQNDAIRVQKTIIPIYPR
jgi:RHS repeat-associated protein